MDQRDIPNLITILRMFLVLPILWLLANNYFVESLYLFAFAGMSDGLDGYLAKRMGWSSRLGSILDPLADKLLLVSTYGMLTWVGIIPVWLTTVIVLRDLLIVIGGLIYHFRISSYDLQPSIVSKINTFLQISYVLGVVVVRAFQWDIGEWVEIATYVVLTTTVLSGADYVWTWGWNAYRYHTQEPVKKDSLDLERGEP
ncbi:MAG: CDP-alcohol phosphatidyltransferase family protein [Gammaproteobacteria bacterium]|jgi:cardiolipin synthase|nr:CDP-alcohol phosphatidyltransferase family protein [Gammaproteobacteria bacterium]MBT3488626.1 CDP-alcohol phosphatidyltransferase family protein [Gammaproteobacteria bacterium]MBT3718269.1 CDP-alcohol phosphatidyltransferase family protein [Gammaproteobacteria bacterium]MBT3846129.1 CDP-alcohol phosphatidyltransferase family protein [Gammaproteobacteria bacterium]MBT3893157.1 CDP-alcohol phosphatidyltransferase family protein [Gammaproteobacteria bacterium]